MNTSCPHCKTAFRIDPSKVPPSGVQARCSVCGGVFHVEPEPATAAAPAAAPPAPATAAAPAPAADPGRVDGPPVSAPLPPAFGATDPEARARRLARALVSDIVAYHPERRDRSLAERTLKQEFREEIRKSWEEYVSQVGDRVARATPHFRDALNDILARGQRVF